ncbi:MAG: SpoIIE family protein phosphatase [Oligoflexia bacterium]|nr:SpoIIE family protein phosphatase [Oligoflexia bacterium]
MSTYVWFALDLFKKDKAANVYEDVLKQSQDINSFVTKSLDSNLLVIQSIISSLKGTDLSSAKRLFLEQKDVVQIRTFGEDKKEIINLISNKYLNDNQISKLELEVFDTDLTKNGVPKFKVINLGETNFIYSQYFDSSRNVYITAKLDIVPILKVLNTSRKFNRLIAWSRNDFIKSEKAQLSVFEKLDLEKNESSAVDRVLTKEEQSTTKIIGTTKSNKWNFYVVNYIERGIAFRAADFLINKSLMFGLLIFSVSVIAGIFFSRKITNQLQLLSEKTLSFAQGNFDETANSDTNDEIGALADSFNFMSSEIRRYIDEMKEKARMENEIAVAKLVQDKFFPNDLIETSGFQIASFYTPASECGGDWWGSFEYKGQTFIAIADATGHGVPAALITATAHCCLKNFEKSLHLLNKEKVDVGLFASMLNDSIASIGGDLLMTAFVMTINNESGEIEYINASHNPPLKYDYTKTIDKKEVIPMMGDVSSRMGEKSDAEFSINREKLEANERLILFTDGIIEIENNEKKQYGQRRFLKSIASHNQKDLKEICEVMVQESFEFSGDVGNDDDVTLLILGQKSEINKSTQSDEDLIIFNDSENFESLLMMMLETPAKAIVGSNSSLLEREKEMARKGISIEAIVGSNLEKYCEELNDSTQVNEIVKNSLDKINCEEYFTEVKQSLFQIGNELLINAFYHSSDETSSQNRKDKVVLENEMIKFCVFQGDCGVGVLVEDSSGKLTRETALKSLMRAVVEKSPEEKDGGAGLGLYLTLKKSNGLFFDIESGKSTKVIAFIEKNKRTKKYLERMTSIHMNFSEGT